MALNLLQLSQAHFYNFQCRTRVTPKNSVLQSPLQSAGRRNLTATATKHEDKMLEQLNMFRDEENNRNEADVAPRKTSSMYADDGEENEGLVGLQDELQSFYDKIFKLLDEGEEDVARALIKANYEALSDQLDSGIQGIEQAALLDVLARCHIDMGDLEDAEQLLEQLKDIMVQSIDHEPLADEILEHIGTMCSDLDKPEEAAEFYGRSLKIQEGLYGNQSPLLVNVLLGLADAYYLKEPDKSSELYQRVLDILEKARGSDDECLALPLLHLGQSFLQEGKFAKAESSLNRALNLTKKASGADEDGRLGAILAALAQAKRAAGEMNASVGYYRESLKSLLGSDSEGGADNPAVEAVRTELVEVLSVMNRHDEAQMVLKDKLVATEKTVGASDPEVIIDLKNLAFSYANSEKLEECEKVIRRWLKLATASYGMNTVPVSVPLQMLAILLNHMQRNEEAECFARQALAIREKSFGLLHPLTGDACSCLAAVLTELGENEEAENLMRRRLKIKEEEIGADDPEIQATLGILVLLNKTLGRDTQALVDRLETLKKKEER